MQRYLSWKLNYSHRLAVTYLLLVLAIVLSNLACTKTPDNERATQPDKAAQFGTSSNLATDASTNRGKELASLNMAIIPWQVSAEQEKRLQPLADYLTRSVGRLVKFHVAKDYDTAVNLLVQGKVELAYLGPVTYIKARLRDPQVQPIVTPIEKTTGRPWYTSIIVVNSASGIKTLKDLKGKRFSFVSKSSTSGYLVPLAYFKEIGIAPDRDFAAVKYAGSHDKVKAKLKSGEVDAIAVDNLSYVAQQKAGELDSSKYKIIWESQPIPNSPIVASSKVSPQLIADLKKAFIKAPDGIIEPSGSESAGYTLARDEDYTPIRKLQERVGLK